MTAAPSEDARIVGVTRRGSIARGGADHARTATSEDRRPLYCGVTGKFITPNINTQNIEFECVSN